MNVEKTAQTSAKVTGHHSASHTGKSSRADSIANASAKANASASSGGDAFLSMLLSAVGEESLSQLPFVDGVALGETLVASTLPEGGARPQPQLQQAEVNVQADVEISGLSAAAAAMTAMNATVLKTINSAQAQPEVVVPAPMKSVPPQVAAIAGIQLHADVQIPSDALQQLSMATAMAVEPQEKTQPVVANSSKILHGLQLASEQKVQGLLHSHAQQGAMAAIETRANVESLVMPMQAWATGMQDSRRVSETSKSGLASAGMEMMAGLNFELGVGSVASAGVDVQLALNLGQHEDTASKWLTGEIKSAAMQIAGLGEDPVEVSINVQGNQTHVAFRSDELQTRAVLETQGDALKDLLRQEGLELASVSVDVRNAAHDGTSQQHDKADRKGGKREPKRVELTSMSEKPKLLRAGGLDIFV
jgi:hypothetical protein